MLVRTLLEQAARCVTEQDAAALLDALETAFDASDLMTRLYQSNAESYMEDAAPFVRFERNKVLSDHYITMIRPEIRAGNMVVVVVTNHMLDGHGMQSQRWEEVEGLEEEVIEATPEQTVAELARLAKARAIENHQALIERLGVPPQVAAHAAAQSW